MDLWTHFLYWWSGPLECRAWTLVPSQTEKTLATLIFIDRQGKKHRWIVGLAYLSTISVSWIKNLAPVDVHALVAVDEEEFGMNVYAPSHPNEKATVLCRGFFPFSAFVGEADLASIGHELKPIASLDSLVFEMLSFLIPHPSNKWFIESRRQSSGPWIYDALYRADGTYEGATCFKPALIHEGLTGRTWKGLAWPAFETPDRHAVVTREPVTGQHVLFILSPHYGRRFARYDAHPDRWPVTEPFWKRLTTGEPRD